MHTCSPSSITNLLLLNAPPLEIPVLHAALCTLDETLTASIVFNLVVFPFTQALRGLRSVPPGQGCACRVSLPAQEEALMARCRAHRAVTKGAKRMRTRLGAMERGGNGAAGLSWRRWAGLGGERGYTTRHRRACIIWPKTNDHEICMNDRV